MKINEKFFENAPKDGEIDIKVQSPPRRYRSDEENTKMRKLGNEDSSEILSQSPASTPSKRNNQAELAEIFQQMMRINEVTDQGSMQPISK